MSPAPPARRSRPPLAPHHPVPADGCHHDARRSGALRQLLISTSAAAPTTVATWQFLLNGLWYSVLDPRDSRRPRVRPLLRVPLLPRRRVAALLSAGAAAADRHARRVHPDPADHSRASASCSTSASPGPIAGFLVAVPVLLVGMSLSRVDAAAARHAGLRRARRTAAVQGDARGCSAARRPTAIRSTCTRWRSRPGSGCWRRR